MVDQPPKRNKTAFVLLIADNTSSVPVQNDTSTVPSPPYLPNENSSSTPDNPKLASATVEPYFLTIF